MRSAARHRVATRATDDIRGAALSLGEGARSTLDAVGSAVAGISATRSRAWAHRAVIVGSSLTLSLSLVGIHDVSAVAATAAPAPKPKAVTAAPAPAPVVYTAPATTAVVAPARDAYGITILPPPETPDDVSWPVPATTPVSSPFGPRVAPCPTCSTDHHGLDLIPGEGTPVASMASGVVVEAASDPSGELGVHVVIRHTIHGQPVDSVYGHLLEGSMPLRVGDRVARAQQVGLVGNTGESTGPHLHFGILIGGQAVDPVTWMAAHANR